MKNVEAKPSAGAMRAAQKIVSQFFAFDPVGLTGTGKPTAEIAAIIESEMGQSCEWNKAAAMRAAQRFAKESTLISGSGVERLAAIIEREIGQPCECKSDEYQARLLKICELANEAAKAQRDVKDLREALEHTVRRLARCIIGSGTDAELAEAAVAPARAVLARTAPKEPYGPVTPMCFWRSPMKMRKPREIRISETESRHASEFLELAVGPLDTEFVIRRTSLTELLALYGKVRSGGKRPRRSEFDRWVKQEVQAEI